MTGAALLLAGLLALTATGWFTCAALRIPGLVGRVLGTFTVGFVWLVAVSLALSGPGWFSRWPLAAALVLGVVTAVGGWSRTGAVPLVPPGTRRSLHLMVSDPVVLVLLAAVVLELVYALVFTLVIPQSDWDSLLYHLPRAAAWVQQGGIGWIPGVADPRLNGFPVHAETATAATMLLGGSDRYVGLVSFLSLATSIVAIHGIGRRLGLGVPQAAFGGLVFATFTVVALQATSALNDLVVAAPLAAATYLALGRARTELGLSAAAVALAVGVKLTAVLAGPLALVVVLVGTARGRRLTVAAAWAAGGLAGSYWYIVARVRTGSFDGGVADFQNQVPDRSFVPTLERVENYLLSFFDVPGVTRADRWLFPLVGLVLAAAGLAALRRGRFSRSLMLSAGIVVVTPLAVYVLHKALSTTFAESIRTLGSPDEADELDRRITSLADTMRSWYGVAFLLLALVTPPLVVRAVRAGTLHRAAIPSALAPLAFVPLFALAVVEDSIRGRFFMLPVALASATFGVALRVRWLAWSAVCLASLTVLLSFVHFDDRPAGIRLIASRTQPSLWSAPRWEALGAHHRVGRDDPRAFRALQELVPVDTVLAYAVGPNEYLYPAYDPHLRRRVLFVPPGGRVPVTADWVMVGPGGAARGCAGAWHRVSTPAPGWRLSRRVAPDGRCESTVPV